MKRAFKIYRTAQACLLTLAALTSCIGQSIDDCPPDTVDPADIPLTLYVDFSENLYTRAAALTEEVEQMHVFVFGHTGLYITTLIDDTPDIGNDYLMEVPLPVGDYEFVGWSNLHSCFNTPDVDLIPGETTIEDLFVELDIQRGDTIGEIPSHLHYGITREPRRRADDGWEYLMEIDRYTYTINILTEGLTPDNDQYRYVIADRNGRFSFYSEDISDRTIYYVADCSRDGAGQLHSTLRVLRLLEDHLDSIVRIENTTTGETLFEDYLITRLLSLREQGETVDFATKHEYTIKLVFSGRTLVSIWIDGWKVYTEDHELSL